MIYNLFTKAIARFRRAYHPLFWIPYIIGIAAGCANIVSPTGGPRDTTPPEVIQETPPSGSTNFSENSFTLRFSEFIQTGNLQQQMLISPPLLNPPELKLRGRNLTIRFNDTLYPNATYAFFFGDAIKDITEGNVMPPYSYFFSTGPTIDQHTLRGTVRNAWDGEVAENILVMLYTLPMADSAVALKQPRYITRPDQNGNFEFRHLADTSYHLFALADLNSNMKYDLPTEGVAFYPEPVRPWMEKPPTSDSSGTMIGTGKPGEPDTSLVRQPDSNRIEADTLPSPARFQSDRHTPLKLRMFIAEDSIQKRLAARSDGRYSAFLVFRYPLNDPQIFSTNEELDSIMIWNLNSRGDTITLWLRQHQFDAIPLILSDQSGYRDTLSITLRQQATPARGRTRETKPTFIMNVPRDGELSPAQEPEIRFSIPLSLFAAESGLLIGNQDTVPLILQQTDTLIQLNYTITNILERGIPYEVLIPEGICTGWDGTTNDTLSYTLTPGVFENYSNLTVIVQHETTPKEGEILLLLTDEKKNILSTKILPEDGTVRFDHLKPGSYFIKAVLDVNRNGQWDPGNYWKKLQPEPIVITPSPVSLRANWSDELVWKITFR